MNYGFAIFDLDGTLLDSMKVWRKHEFDIIESALGVSFDMDEMNKLKALPFTEMISYAEEKCCGKFDYESNIVKLNAMMKDDYATGPIYLKPEAGRFLSWLRANGVKLGVSTATPRELCVPCLKRLGIFDVFDSINTTPEVGKSKTHPDVFDKTMSELGGTKQDTMVFEDALYSIRTLAANGFRFTAVEDSAQVIFRDEIKAISPIYIKSYSEIIE